MLFSLPFFISPGLFTQIFNMFGLRLFCPELVVLLIIKALECAVEFANAHRTNLIILATECHMAGTATVDLYRVSVTVDI
ncbi:hypothetical protein FRI78_14770 [Salmonella enterica]|uniref:Uncharacterized protein n=1 Tax=Salmonella enterica TaxID=28901 RepID=A0A5Y5LBF5_SALER|nr:hypothetical protein [Salmonella enterica]